MASTAVEHAQNGLGEPKNDPKKDPLRTQPRKIFVDYGQPELKVVVRLLPPTLKELDFTHQLNEKLNQKDQLKLSKEGPELHHAQFYYEPGSRKVKPFEEPIYSRAYFQFRSVQEASDFSSKVGGISFEEPETGEKFTCQTMKSIFGAVGNPLEIGPVFDLTAIPLYSKYLAARKEQGNNVNVAELQHELAAAEKKARRSKLRAEKPKKKKASKKPKSRPDLANLKLETKNEVKKEEKGEPPKKPKGSSEEPPKKPKSKKTKKPKTEISEGTSHGGLPTGPSTGSGEEAKEKKKKAKKPKKPKAAKGPKVTASAASEAKWPKLEKEGGGSAPKNG